MLSAAKRFFLPNKKLTETAAASKIKDPRFLRLHPGQPSAAEEAGHELVVRQGKEGECHCQNEDSRLSR